ncbi:MAG TPA: BON domain-containing protein [Stellaceae bacterium]|nr:BON domain-containing protein [Stellaceae bacterium]
MSDDRVLQQRVMDELAFDPTVDAAHIGVTARDGIITLTGHAKSYAEKFASERAARRVKGVKAVAQEIDVRLPSDKKTADDEIAARAIKILDWDVVMPPGSIRVKVENGVVTLAGEVDWGYQRSQAEHDVHRLSGVSLIVNQIRVRPQAQPADVKATIAAAFERTAEHEASAITVDVRDGVVHLSGKVQSWVEREEALRAAWSVPGVTGVEDHLLIARP